MEEVEPEENPAEEISSRGARHTRGKALAMSIVSAQTFHVLCVRWRGFGAVVPGPSTVAVVASWDQFQNMVWGLI